MIVRKPTPPGPPVHLGRPRIGPLIAFLGADVGVARSGQQPGPLRLLAARCCDLVLLLLATYLVCRLWFLGTAPPLVVITVTATTIWGCSGFLYLLDTTALSRRDPETGRRAIQSARTSRQRLVGTLRVVGMLVSVAFVAPFFGGLIAGFLGLCGVILLVFALFVAYYWACWTRAGTTLGGRIFRLRLVRVDEDRLTLGDVAWRLLFLLCRYLDGGYAIWRVLDDMLDDITLEETAQATVVIAAAARG